MDHQGIPSHFLTEENILKNIYFWGMWKGRDRVTPCILRRLIIIRTWLSLAQSFFSLSSLLVEHDLVQIYGGKTLPKMQEIWVWSLDWKDPLEKRMATHSSIPAWKISWTEQPDGLQSMGSQKSQKWLSTKQYICMCVVHMWYTHSVWILALHIHAVLYVCVSNQTRQPEHIFMSRQACQHHLLHQ